MINNNPYKSSTGDRMNVLFLSIGGLAELNENAVYPDLLRCFRDNGHSVYVVCQREKRTGLPTQIKTEYGMQVLRVKTGNITKSGLIEKGIATLLIGSQFKQAINKYFSGVKFDLVLYSTPPITIAGTVAYIKKRDNAFTYLMLKDIFPQNAVDLQMFTKRSLIYRYFRGKEKRLYAQSDCIGCMSRANVDFVLRNNPEISSDIVEICPNSVEPVAIEKDENTIIKIKKKYDIPLDKTVFIYGGNLGKPQGIDFLIECLKANQTGKQIHFVIAGSGTDFNKLKAFMDTEKPANTQLFTQLPKNDYETLVNSCDVGLIFLDKRFTIPNFPSRLLSHMQASMPVLAATDVNTDVGKVIEDGGFGCWCESGDVESFNRKLQQLCDEELRKRMGEKARRYLEDNYTANHSYKIIMKHFK